MTTKTNARRRPIRTNNEEWGFYGTTQSNEGASDRRAARDFNEAAQAAKELFGLSDDEARDLLDARDGRHIADARRDGESPSALLNRLVQTWGRRYFERTLKQLAAERARD
jgi:hypothetical protein